MGSRRIIAESKDCTQTAQPKIFSQNIDKYKLPITLYEANLPLKLSYLSSQKLKLQIRKKYEKINVMNMKSMNMKKC